MGDILKNPLPVVYYSFAVDSLRAIITKKSKKSLQNLNGFFWQKVEKNTPVSASLKAQIQRKDYKGLPKPNRCTTAEIMRISEGEHLASFLTFKTTQTLNAQSDYKKGELGIHGLTQPHEAPKTIYKPLAHIFSKITLSSVDVCIDLPSEAMPTIEALERFCPHPWIRTYQESIYLNTPTLKGIDRIIIYNKQSKERTAYPWTRIEFTCKADTKLKEFEAPFSEIVRFIDEVYGVETPTVSRYNEQMKLLTDLRSYNQRRNNPK